ncbi:hypothetical protein GLAREA_12484 [Glarea lozoyensis ATCC 20868]|uniref:Uncharacterized protein n=1 Tax=Glarea lozoyensis (strain ATCC 20868 / MF5171) TaxID=1116229 RepID=S3DZI8_GLAL2|nr:uncharacterized protein GLAREA_12484 [Glarea lozoyensis ATCC 20868]EPE31728.1 hypothetical protein GLAREA_12484 [Glarea lozoyensis ATCC 20868]
MVGASSIVLLLAVTHLSSAIPHPAKPAVAHKAVLSPRQTDAPAAGTPWEPAPECYASPPVIEPDLAKVIKAVRNPPQNYDISSFCSAGLQRSLVAWEVSTIHSPSTTTIYVSRTVLIAPTPPAPSPTKTKTKTKTKPHYPRAPAPTPAPVFMERGLGEGIMGGEMVKRDFEALPPFLEEMNVSVYVLNWLANACSCVITAARADVTYTTHTREERVVDVKTVTVTRT